MLIEILLLCALLALAGGAFFLFQRQRKARNGEAEAQRARDGLDTLAAWPPEVTRLLTGGERSAHETLVKALPECMIFSQVPLARFIRVPRRYSYADWLTRVGHLSADFLICDRASLVIAAVSLQTAQDSERADRRRARMARVLKAAGVKVFVWREHAIPAPAAARDEIFRRTGVPGAGGLEATSPQRQQALARNAKIPVPEVLEEQEGNGPQLEPPPSTWFDDLDSAPTPLGPAERRPS